MANADCRAQKREGESQTERDPEESPLQAVKWKEVDSQTLSKLCLEARGEIERLLESKDSIDSKAMALLAAGSIISGLMGAIQFSVLDPARLPHLPWCFRLAAILLAPLLFVAWFLPTVLSMQMYPFKTTLAWKEEQLAETYLPMDPDQLDRQLFYNYVQAIELNDKTLRRKAILCNVAMWLLAVNVIYLLIISILFLF